MATDLDTEEDQLANLRELAAELTDAEAVVEMARDLLHQAIAEAHVAGVHWQQITAATGLSKPRVYQVIARQGATAKGSPK